MVNYHACGVPVANFTSKLVFKLTICVTVVYDCPDHVLKTLQVIQINVKTIKGLCTKTLQTVHCTPFNLILLCGVSFPQRTLLSLPSSIPDGMLADMTHPVPPACYASVQYITDLNVNHRVFMKLQVNMSEVICPCMSTGSMYLI